MTITADQTAANSAEVQPIISMRGVWKFFGKLAALKDINLDVMPGEKVVIIGPSGSGKSTALRTINRLETIDRGSIMVEGSDIRDSEHDINLIDRKSVV